MNLGASELFLVLFVILLLFGGKRLPELARNLGRGFAEIRRVTYDVKREMQNPLSDTSTSAKNSRDTTTKSTPVNAHPASQPRTTPKPTESDS